MGILSLSDARKALGPFEARLRAAVERAFGRWRARIAPHFALPTRRMRANALHDLMIEEVTTEFDGTAGATIVRGAGRTFLRFAPSKISVPVLVQFKKLSDERKPRNYPTQTALAFDLQLPVPDIADDARLTAGYRLNRMETDILDVSVVCMAGSSAAWMYEIAAPAVATLPTPIGAPAATSTATKKPLRLRPAAGIRPPTRRRPRGSGGAAP